MYQLSKSILLYFFPKKFINKHKTSIRRLIAFFYRGNQVECNLCDSHFRKFPTSKVGGLVCPKCGSLSRTRNLWMLLETELVNKKILHFSPSPIMVKKVKDSRVMEYITTDYLGEFDAMKSLNIEAIDEPDNYFDIVICFHVLEHVENDQKAMGELLRILKPLGYCLIQTPFKNGQDVSQDPSIVTPEDRLKHYGQEDHLRLYSVAGLEERLKSNGFHVERIVCGANARLGIDPQIVIKAMKK